MLDRPVLTRLPSIDPAGHTGDVELLVAADDRTGAYETAAHLAGALGIAVPVTAWPARPELATTIPSQPAAPDAEGCAGHSVGVVDLGSRHLGPGEARDRSAALVTAGRHAHKIDSTLRGNWADELAAYHRPVLLVPALPVFGRVCRDGIVFDNGLPVHASPAGTDVRRRITSSRPADLLRSAGVAAVCDGCDPASVARWLDEPEGVCVADVADDETIDALVAAWRDADDEIVLAGTGVAVGRAFGGAASTGATTEVGVDGAILVVCGSVHPTSRAQLATAERTGVTVTYIADSISARALARDGVLILASEIPVGDVDEPLAVAAASELARGARSLTSAVDVAATIVIGGDTAAALIGPATVEVRGTLGGGTAVLDVDGWPCEIVTRSGGFGDDGALVGLIGALRRPSVA